MTVFSFFSDVFRRLKVEEGSTDRQELYVFQLYSNSSYYLATSPEMGLQIQVYISIVITSLRKHSYILQTSQCNVLPNPPTRATIVYS